MDPTATLWLGIAGLLATLVGALLGSLLGPALAARRQRAESLHQQRVALYVDATLHAQAARRRYDLATDALLRHHRRDRGGSPTLAPADEISARIALLAPPAVSSAWGELLGAQYAWDFEWQETMTDPDEEYPANHPTLVRLRDAADALIAACREAATSRS